MPDAEKASEEVSEKSRELKAFLLLTVVTVPVLAVAIVGGYGFLVWMMQVIVGPPTA